MHPSNQAEGTGTLFKHALRPKIPVVRRNASKREGIDHVFWLDRSTTCKLFRPISAAGAEKQDSVKKNNNVFRSCRDHGFDVLVFRY